MSAEIASLEKVRAAATQIRANGETATADRVIAYLGGGSKATVLRHLKVLRDADQEVDIVPPGILDMAKAALAEIYQAGVKAGADRSAAGLVRLTASIGEVEAQIEELAAENEKLVEGLESMKLERDAALTRAIGLEATVAKTAQELQDARTELLQERGASAEKLAKLMARVEEGVASMSRLGGTLRLPRDRGQSG